MIYINIYNIIYLLFHHPHTPQMFDASSNFIKSHGQTKTHLRHFARFGCRVCPLPSSGAVTRTRDQSRKVTCLESARPSSRM